MDKVELTAVRIWFGFDPRSVRSWFTCYAPAMRSLCTCCAVLMHRSCRSKSKESLEYVGQDRLAASELMRARRCASESCDGRLGS
jgi:hypothetical protein